MVSSRENYQYRSYGAIELKMTYQRNMLIANAMVLSLLASTLISVWALTLGDNIVIPVKPEPISRDTISAFLGLGQDITIIRDKPTRPRSSAPSDAQGWNLVPVEDDLIIEDRSLPDDGNFGGVGDPTVPGNEELGYNPPPGGEPVDAIPEYGDFVLVEKKPEMVVEAKPEYPAFARRLGLEGKVVMGALVGSDGRVRDTKVVVSSGSEALDQAAIEAAYRTFYTPGIQNGRPIPVWVTYTVEFTMNE